MSVRKETSGRRSIQVEVPGSAQSAAARRSAEAQVRTLIAKFAPAHLRLVGAMRRSLRKRLPTAHEVVYEYPNQGAVVISYSPNERGYEGVLGIRATADGVRLYLSCGKELADPEKLLQGSAQARWIDVEGASTLARPAVARLIDEAIARNPVPFARAPAAGRWLLVRHRPRSVDEAQELNRMVAQTFLSVPIVLQNGRLRQSGEFRTDRNVTS